MRWERKEIPNLGDTRIIRGFLLWPRTLNGETRWMEWANIQQTYIEDLKQPFGWIWVDSDWVV